MNIPTIGGARGIFEVFVPGLFLILNVGLVVYLLPWVDNETKDFILASASNPVLLLVIGVGFGYLTGVLLRMLRTDLPERWATWWLQTFDRGARQENGEYKLYACDRFPYIDWLGEECQEYLPSEAQEFYENAWANYKRPGRQNKQFFNFCKIMINSNDERAANEIQAAESLSRYVGYMFHALAIAFPLMFFAVVSRYIVFRQITAGPLIVLIAYCWAMTGILRRFRFIRFKEVETVFAASFANRSIFEEKRAATDPKNVLKIIPNWLRHLLNLQKQDCSTKDPHWTKVQ